jgi:hypothetical protein
VNDILQLVHVYPLDMMTKEGNPFWVLPKRPPTPIEFNSLSKAHQDFIASTACLFATIFKIKIPFENPRDHIAKEKMAEIASGIEIEKFEIDTKKAKAISSQVKKEEEKHQAAEDLDD